MPKVFYTTPFSRDLKTTCCEVSIHSEDKCPKCDQKITPKGIKARRDYAAGRK